jgi:hypothetical protein
MILADMPRISVTSMDNGALLSHILAIRAARKVFPTRKAKKVTKKKGTKISLLPNVTGLDKEMQAALLAILEGEE